MDEYITIKNISLLVGGIIALIYIISLIRVMLYERKINKLTKELENKISQAKLRRASMVTIEAMINKLKEDCEPEIEKLQRKRRFILEKLPFIKR